MPNQGINQSNRKKVGFEWVTDSFEVEREKTLACDFYVDYDWELLQTV